MCGILGCSLRQPLTDSDIKRLERGISLLHHRGPDGNGRWMNVSQGIFLGHTRLAILDLSKKNAQPMKRGNSVLTYNGELYNYREIKTDLEKLGCHFSTEGDTEVILQAWKKWGVKALDRFDGMFAFALLDDQGLHLVTDPFGEKPLYVVTNEKGIWFASEAQVLIEILGLRPSISCEDKVAFLTLGFIPSPSTGFKEMKQLSPATHCSFLEGQKKDSHRYWRFPESTQRSGRPRPLSESDLDQIQEALVSSVKHRVRADVPLGIFLSSGVDSALVAAIVAKDLGLDIEAFTVAFPDGIDESKKARTIADYLGLSHRIIDSRDTEDWKTAPSQLLDLYGLANDNLTALSVRQMSFLARRHMKVALTGTGGDEMFYGYGKYFFLYKHRHTFRWLGRLSEYTRPLDFFFNRIEFWRRTTGLIRGGSSWQFLSVKNNGLGNLLSVIPDAKSWTDGLLPFNDRPLAMRVREFDINQTLPNSYIASVDRGSMRAGLEVRTPFLSRDLAEILSTFDQRAFLAFGQKEVLRRVAERYLPKTLLAKGKQGFVFPAERYLATKGDNIPEVTQIPSVFLQSVWNQRTERQYQGLAMRLAVLEMLEHSH